MATPFAGIIDQLRRTQPEASKVVLPDVASRLPALGQIGATVKSNIVAALEARQSTPTDVKPPWQGFSHTPGMNRAPHPHYSDGSQATPAFTQGFRDYRRRGK
jgi:hypothetical protein